MDLINVSQSIVAVRAAPVKQQHQATPDRTLAPRIPMEKSP